MQEFFVRPENIRGAVAVLVERFGAQLLRTLAMIFRVADPTKDLPRCQVVVFDLQLGHCQLDGRKLVVVVVNGKIPRQAGRSRFAPQKARAERMKRGKPRLRGRDSSAQQEIRKAIAHLFRGFVGERDGEDGFGGHSLGDQICHAIRDRAGLAGARASEDQHRAFGGLDG